MPKAPKPRLQHAPLYKDIADSSETGILRQKSSKQKKGRENVDRNGYMDAKASKRVLQLAREQQEELEQEESEGKPRSLTEEVGYPQSSYEKDTLENPVIEPRDEDDDSDQSDAASNASDSEEFGEDDEYEELDIDETDRKLFDKFFPESNDQEKSDAPEEQSTNLSDLIMQKISEAEARSRGEHIPTAEEEEEEAMPPLPPKVIEVFSKVGVLLSKYRSGKIPKAFKIIPTLSNWEEILYITRPDTWTPHACYEATRIFISNLKPIQAQHFLNVIILERVREDIQTNKKLNYHLYMALKKALYKPSAFFKGFLFPLVSENCSLREAAIVGSVLVKVSVPVLHSAAALLRLTEFDVNGASSVFIRILLDKKYALPYKVLDSLVFYFMRWKALDRPLAVLEHQSMLVFAQRYKFDITPEQKDALLEVVRVKGHYSIGPEIRRELVNSASRGEEIPQEMEEY
ncbi:bystin family U3 and U14 snoRNA associated protein [Schizosaccharomyces octosporus yFS286]|uniref:Bystin family U3 and U14 snoRNA associated protein n=1 Tax=Schizosaccharomyces octosporus (strain yFS286) TaxID=483514 RepID=S9PPI7_SCHOY|nr:bystin family U3 and U14 snoRNA associated protein [Schizosaccharomyces octosporus yFS286]EPX71126.1 bystin family U3 and U14 snoRNA associated protein [Schizosaccharomyces octosporus yFS286]